MSGWCTTTVDAVDEQAADQLREAFDKYQDSPGTGARDDSDDTVRALIWGYDGDHSARTVLRHNPDLWECAVVMRCNDTTDSGSGSAYESTDSGMEELDYASGAEGAMGRDAADNLRLFISGHVFMR